VDTWLGSEEHILDCPAELLRVNGYPRLYYQFLSNVIHRRAQDWIVPLPTTSLTAANLLSQLGIEADLVHIDANHQYDAVMTDLTAFLPLIRKGGIMFGHDYFFDSVKRAVSEFCATHHIGTIGRMNGLSVDIRGSGFCLAARRRAASRYMPALARRAAGQRPLLD
jgi:hypothetical protein